MRPGARIKARTPEEFERWRRLAEKRLRQSNNDTTNVTPRDPMEVKK
jgi:hypothetical protein